LQRNPGQVSQPTSRKLISGVLLRWHWKAAVLSAGFRGLVFLLANLRAGHAAAARAMAIELIYAALASGVMGTAAQRLRRTRPRWLGGVLAGAMLPAAAHMPESVIHWAARTPKLKTSVIASISATVVSGLFN
jgi:thiamine transporter ThiT